MQETTILTEKKKPRRLQTLGEEIGNSITHGVAAIFAIVATILMLLKCDNIRAYVGVSIYGFCMLMLYLMSCLYHSFKNGSVVKRVFRIFDHTSIFLLIGGTYAPILLVAIYQMNQKVALAFFGIQWGLIFLGILGKIFIKQKTTILHTILCVLLGWSGIFILPMIYSYNQIFFYLILAGGIAYMLGIFFYAATFKYAHFVWHFFCIFGTILHFVAIYLYVL